MTNEKNEQITQKDLATAINELEVRFRRLWKDDIRASNRGQLNDVLSHVESRLEKLIEKIVARELHSAVSRCENATESLTNLINSDRAYWERYKSELKNEIAAITLEVLKDYQVLDENSTPKWWDAWEQIRWGKSQRDESPAASSQSEPTGPAASAA